MAEPRFEVSGDLRTDLVAATVALLDDHEPSAISLRAVARHLGVSSGAPYHHFPDKLTLLAEVAQKGFEELNAMLVSVDASDPEVAVPELARRYLQFARVNAARYRVMLLPELKTHPGFEALHAESHRSLVALAEPVARALGAPLESPTVIGRVTAAWATVHGFVQLLHSGVLDQKTEAVDLEVLVDEVARAAARAAIG